MTVELSGRTIVFLNNYAGPGLGGGEIHLLGLIRACRDAGMAVRLICEPDGVLAGAARELGVVVDPHGFGGPRVAANVLHVRGYCRRHGADILHATGWLTNIVGRLAASRGVPALVNSVHCEPDSYLSEGGSVLGQRLRDMLDHATCKRADAVCPVSAAIAAKLAGLGYARERIHVIPNGVDLQEIARLARGAAEELDALGDGPAVGIVARLVPVKAVDDFLRAAAIILRECPEAYFVVVGDGPQAGALKALAGQLGVADRTLFVGLVSSAVPYVARFDVDVLTSRSEGAGIALLEGMALGKPCVATNVGGVPEIVDEGRTGLLVPPSDPQALAAGVLQIIGSPSSAAAMGEAGRRRVEDRFTVERMGDAYLRLYARVLA